MWSWLMDFWRTLFGHHGQNKATQPIAATIPAPPYVAPLPAPLPTFQTLVFSSTSFTRGTPSSGAINNATVGSVIVAVGLPAGLTINSLARTWAWDGNGSISSGSFSLYENIPGSPGNPNSSTIGYTIIGAAAAYDTRWGTSTDANGWITFALPGARRRVWCDSARADDSGDGLSPATAKKTFNAAFTVFTNGSWNAGDQLMLAGGTAGGSYTDTTSSSLTTHGGTGPSVMTVVQSYDRADPTGATTPFGRLVGAAMPVLTLVDGTSTSLQVNNVAGSGYVAVQGIEIKATNTLAYQSLGVSSQTNNHPGLVWQNCRFNGTGIGLNPATGTNTAGANSQGALVSKCSMWNSSGIYCESYDGFWMQDVVIGHCGWNIGASRDDIVANGGAQVFTHNLYYHASNTNGRFDRIVAVDGATESLSLRGDVLGGSQIVSIDNPFALNAGGFSTAYTEAPNGINYKLDDVVIMGSDKIDSTHPGATGLQWNNTLSGSYIRNVAIFDYQDFDLNDIVYNRYSVPARSSSSQVPQYMLLDKWSGWRWGPVENNAGNIPTDPTNVHGSWSNSITDMVPVGLNGTITNCSSRSIAPAGYKTRAQTWTAMGFASKAALINAMLYRPDLPWAQAIASISLPAMGLTPAYALVSPPSVASPPSVYPTALGNLTIGTLNFTRGTAATTLLSGTSGNPALSCSDLPAGFTLVGRLLSYDGTGSGAATPTIHVLETSKDTLGTHTTAFTLAISGGTVWATNADWTLTNASLTAQRTGTGTFWDYELTSAAKTNGTADFTIDAMGSAANDYVGVSSVSEGGNSPGSATSIFWRQDGALLYAGSTIATLATWTTADKLRIVKAAGNYTFYKWNGSSWVQQGSVIDSTSAGYGLGTVIAGACYPSLASQNNTGFQVTADFSAF